jgi:hypothetical protein
MGINYKRRKENYSEKLICALNSIKILWHIDPLLGNDHETNNYTAVVTRKEHVNSNRKIVLSALSADVCPSNNGESNRGTVFSVRFVLDVISRTISES